MNFVLFMPDEMHAEAAGCYGHPLVKTPHLDRMAAAGTRFGQCYAQHPVCSPSRCSMMTGWYPHVAGHRTLWHLLRPHEPNLLKYLKRAGYDCRWFGKNDLLAPGSFAESVTEVVPPAGRNAGPLLRGGPEDPLYDSFLGEPFAGDPWDTADAHSVRGGIEFLRGKHDRPFFLYLPLGQPHPTYSCPQPFHDMYSAADVPPLRPGGGAAVAGKPAFHELIRRTRRLGRLDDATLRRIHAVYLGQISYVDYLLGGLLDALDETGLAEDTCVIFTTDHGDWAGHWGLVEKWPSALDDLILRIPLAIRLPKGAGGAAGHVVGTPVELFDIMATVLELAGVPAPHTHFAQSLVAQLRGAAGDAGRAAFAEGGYALHEPHCFEGHHGSDTAGWGPEHIYFQKAELQQTDPLCVCRSAMVRTAGHKLIWRTDDACELYDMTADPTESANLYGRPEHADLQRSLESRLLDWYVRTADVTPWDEDPRGLPKGGVRGQAPRLNAHGETGENERGRLPTSSVRAGRAEVGPDSRAGGTADR